MRTRAATNSLAPAFRWLAAGVAAAVCAMLATPSVLAQEAAAFSLSVRPSICVSYDSEAPCRMAMQVSWEGTQARDVCLFQAGQDAALACWDHARSGSTEVQHADANDVQYRLQDAISRAVLAEADVKVINRDLRVSRKRRRHVWSIL